MLNHQVVFHLLKAVITGPFLSWICLRGSMQTDNWGLSIIQIAFAGSFCEYFSLSSHCSEFLLCTTLVPLLFSLICWVLLHYRLPFGVHMPDAAPLHKL